MESNELLRKVRKIELKTKGLSKHIFSGEYHSAFKGRGMSFSEVREYQYGDDVRNIDWNVTARTSDPHVKIFEEERELTVMLIIDLSASSFFGTEAQFKNELLTEIAAVIAFSAIQNNDKVGVILFSDSVEKYIPPKKGKSHILLIIRELLTFKSTGKGTNLSEALEYFNNVQTKRCICFILSDFMTDNYKQALSVACNRHDIVGCQLYDPKEQKLPELGRIRLKDAETGKIITFNSSDASIQEQYAKWFEQHTENFKSNFYRSGGDVLSIRTDESYIHSLLQFFKRRKK